jgi:hypothetical protein
MEQQHYKNHSRIIILWHFITGILVIAIFILAILNFIHSLHGTMAVHYNAALILGISFVLVVMFWYARAFALKAQDRGIRAEENFRHFVLTGKPLDSTLRLGQIIALRFASDAEMPALAKKAADENLSSKQIKESIKDWRGDYHRV